MAALAPGDRGVYLLADLLERIQALGWHRLLEPVDVTCFFKRAAEADGGRHVEPAMRVDQQLDIRSGCFADKRSELGSLALVLAGHAAVEIAVALLAGHLAIRPGPCCGNGSNFSAVCPDFTMSRISLTMASLLVNLAWLG